MKAWANGNTTFDTCAEITSHMIQGWFWSSRGSSEGASSADKELAADDAEVEVKMMTTGQTYYASWHNGSAMMSFI